MKTKKINYKYVLIAFIAIMLITSHVFDLVEAFGKAMSN